jgi:2-polyprenyl-3-methyl-5-hydroxy-6-metoxy-1,4-benzoquinol methylase
MTPYIVRKTVLDLGCVDHTWTRATDLFHGYLCEKVLDIVGLDYPETDVAKLNESGYHIICGDAEDFDLSGTFNVVVAAELVEHLEDHRSFLESSERHVL